MTGFILTAIAITGLSLWVLIRPFRANRRSEAYEREAQNIHFARERLQELEDQLKNAAISATDYEALKLEIEATLATDIDFGSASDQSQESDTESAEQNNGMMIVLLCIVVPLAAYLLYSITGTPEAIDLKPAPAQQAQQHDVDDMLNAVEERLKGNPDDAQGWAILARSYLARGQYQDSIRANQALLDLTGEDANILAQMADAAALAARGDLAGTPTEYVKRALALDPQQPQALWLAGLASAQRGNTAEARDYWNKLMPLLAAAPQQQEELREIIQQTHDQDAKGPVASTAAPQSVPLESAPEQSATSALLKVRVELDPAMAELVTGDETVFIFARAQNGPPAPLAVKPIRVADLPADVSLSDENAMMPQFKLSLFKDVVVSARIAKSGNPVAQPGDIQSDVVATANDNPERIRLLISSVIE